MIPGVRQRLVDGAPVVETLLRVGGGEVVQRCFGANAQLDVVAVEFENLTSGPVALALAVRPYDVQGGGRINQARCDDRVVEIDGEAALVLERRPGAVVTGTGGMDPASRLDLLEEPDGAAARWLTCDDGSGAMAMVLPLVHGSTMRVAILPPGCGVGDVPPDVVDRLPTGEQVARGWGRHATSGCRVVLPAGRIAEGFDAVRQSLPLAVVGGSEVEPAPFGPPADPDDLLDTVSALAELGYATACRDVLVAWARRQDRLGAMAVQGIDVTAVSLLALDRVHSLHPDAGFLAALSEVVADAARWLLQQDVSPAGMRALSAAHHLLSEVGAIRAAAELEALGHGTKPVAQTAPDISDLLYEDRSRPLGYDVLATAKALVEDIAHQRTVALDRLDAVLGQASSCWSWPTHVHPRLGTGTGGAGHDLRVAAAVARSVRGLLVGDGDAGCLALAPVWPASWVGQPVEVHGLACTAGLLSWAVRWHGDRPALLWEVEQMGDRAVRGPLVVTAPGLDPHWRGTGAQGEALLAPVVVEDGSGVEAPSEGDADSRGPSFS